MSSLVLKHLPLLEVLSKVNSKSRKKIIETCDLKLTEAIIECIFNVLRNNIQLEKSDVKKLRRHKKTLHQLVCPSKKLNKKKTLMIQSGGSFLPLILTPIVSYFLDKIVS